MTPTDHHELRTAADRLAETPGIGTIEIAQGMLRLSLPPTPEHQRTLRQLVRQLQPQVKRTHPAHQVRTGIALEGPSFRRIPDLLVTSGRCTPADAVLVAEVASVSNPATDYDDKVRDYAAMGIPLYLLVDPRKGTGIVHDQPGYTSRTPFAFGDTVTVGPWSIDTGVLLTYA